MVLGLCEGEKAQEEGEDERRDERRDESDRETSEEESDLLQEMYRNEQPACLLWRERSEKERKRGRQEGIFDADERVRRVHLSP